MVRSQAAQPSLFCFVVAHERAMYQLFLPGSMITRASPIPTISNFTIQTATRGDQLFGIEQGHREQTKGKPVQPVKADQNQAQQQATNIPEDKYQNGKNDEQHKISSKLN